MDIRKSKNGSGRNCAVRGCINTWKRRNEWLDRECVDHRPATKRQCPCSPLYTFYRKPTTDLESRMWLEALNLKKPPKTIFVCSHHFVDKEPTKENPFPELWLGYDRPPQTKRRKLVRNTGFGFPSAGKDVDSTDWAPSVNLGYQQDEPMASRQQEERLKSREADQTCTDAAAALLDRGEFVGRPESEYLKGFPSAGKDVDSTPMTNDEPMTEASRQQEERLKSREADQTCTDASAALVDCGEFVGRPESEYLKEFRCGDIFPGVPARTDHDYAVAPTAGALDAASVRIQQLEAKVQELEAASTQQKVGHLHFRRFCASDEDIRFYTGFPSEEVFNVFWEAVQPSASMLVYWSKAQKKGLVSEPTSPSPTRRLQLIDEFFLYSCCVAAGLKEKVLADIFQVSVSTVCSIVITWANYLYLVLGSLPIWMSRQQVKSTMPPKFRQYCPEVRVIIDCTEVRCQSPLSRTRQSEGFSSYKSTTTFKGLIGIAPCGAVIFVSRLYLGPISDQELFERCGMLDLLEPGDGCLADKGFAIKKMLADRGAKLITPSFKTTEQFNKEGARKTQAIIQLQILVERTIRRVKEYRIWNSTLPLTLSGSVNQLWTNCCLMTNFQAPL